MSHPNQRLKNHPWLPVGSLLLAATLWGLFWYPLRLLEQAGLHGLWATLLIYCGTMPLALYYMHGRYREMRGSTGLLFLLAISSGWCNTAFILAMLDGNVLRVLLLFYLAPVWTVILGFLFLDERPDRQGMIVILFAFIGALFMLWDPSIGLPLPRDHADWLALSSGMSFAITNVCVRKVQAVSVPVKTVMAWVGSLLIAGVLILTRDVNLAVTGTPVYLALFFGAGVMVIMTTAVQYGVTNMPVHRSAVILLFELVVGAISASLLTHEKILPQEWLGGALVVAAAYLSVRKQVDVVEETS
ncbi:MAG: DMT family transporter [Gammaproteobacteria bacterium]|nr:DMT family transporter [Gammaproteobacteria bacterium]MDH5652813.1 DMT family transporter [Gammaproteobacteria bacterium]